MRGWRTAVAALAGSLVLSACRDEPRPAPTESVPTAGHLSVQAGSLEAEVPLAAAECHRPTDGHTIVRVPGTQKFEAPEGDALHPHHLALRLPRLPDAGNTLKLGRDTDWRASASLFGLELHGHDYEMMQLVAARVEGHPFEPRCEISGEPDEWRVVCTAAKPIPWLGTGSVPEARFEANFTCSADE